jgi:4-amino-4-deoxy-L-arabinose transferase-like glycosyltransferase
VSVDRSAAAAVSPRETAFFQLFLGPKWWPRLFLLGLLWVAFAHTAIGLDAKDLWWDESLSLQRAEEDLGDLVRGVIWISDGFTQLETIDQHPFFSFWLQSLLIRAAGDSVYVLRYLSALAAVLFTAGVYLWARWLERHDLALPATAWWATALAAVNPFLLWYGQEARPYALWAALIPLAAYLLLRATENARVQVPSLCGFVAVATLAILTHYYAFFLLLPSLALLMWSSLRQRIRFGLLAAGVLALIGAALGGSALWSAVRQQAGQNFAPVTLDILLLDLLNAFSLGPSSDPALAWPLNLLFAALILLGARWGVRSRDAWRRGGWILPAGLILPILGVHLLGYVQPLYMNSRHLGMLAGLAVLLTGAGLAIVAHWNRWLLWLLALLLGAGITWSTVNYYSLDRYAKDDYSHLGNYLEGRVMPGDVLLYYPPSSWRIFDYYLPVAPVYAAAAEGARLGIYGLPLLNQPPEATYRWLAGLGERFDRVWVVKSRTHPYFDLEDTAERWLRDHFLRVRDVEFFSQSMLRAQLYLPTIPVFEGTAPAIQTPVTAEFGGLLRLVGYADAVEPASAALPTQLRLYWQVTHKPERRYRYIWRLLEQENSGLLRTLATVEREPYEGDIPTLYWDPGKTILEYVELPPVPPASPHTPRFYALQVYDAETLEKLPVSASANALRAPDGVTLFFPLPTP